ncbi:MAG TPA: post-COAP-1 domain-containing protein [Gemmatimonadales bacterium]|jgi:hypothetical protein|nr:post-COAP-1 domain-containing protein [Gemmatimonadales bacterium]
MQILRRTATVLIGPALASLGAGCDRLDAPAAVVEYGVIPGGGPGKVTGGGQIDIIDATGATIGKGTFGFNARREPGPDGPASGHINYLNHVTGVHLNCEIESGGVFSAPGDDPGVASFGGYECTPNSTFSNGFTFRVVDAGEPGRNDSFTITYVTDDGATINDGGPTIRSGNIQVHK